MIDTMPRRAAPPRIYDNPDAPAIAYVERLDELDGAYDPSRPQPVHMRHEIDDEDAEWAAAVGMSKMITSREGATFLRLAGDVFVIAVYGAQYLHEDRHLAEMPNANGFSEHTWNLSVDGGEDQHLLLEVAQDVFTTLPLSRGSFSYMNTVNRHAVTRRTPHDVVVLVQVDGFGPEEGELAFERIAEVLASRPDPVRV